MIKTLLVTGANNHDWKRSAPFCEALLERTGKFSVDLTEDPASVLADSNALKRYQLIFLDYNGPDWGEPAKSNFVAAVEGGTGVVALHAADNPFEGWADYERMLALLWRPGAGHGQYFELSVNVVDHHHPITRGMSDFKLWDELYHALPNPQDAPYRVLAVAYSDPAKGGRGRYEPVMLVTQFGRGRVYQSVLGHVWAGQHVWGNDSTPPDEYKGTTMMTFENPGFQQSLIRGAEWAATGQVTE